MTFDGSHALRFINQARAATGLPALTELPFTGAVRVDERACLLARALQAEVGGSADPRFSDHLVMRLGNQTLARAIASRTGQPCNDRAEVLLPDPLARLAVAFDRGQVKPRGATYVAPGQLSSDDLAGEIDLPPSLPQPRPRQSAEPRRDAATGSSASAPAPRPPIASNSPHAAASTSRSVGVRIATTNHRCRVGIVGPRRRRRERVRPFTSSRSPLPRGRWAAVSGPGR